MTEREALGGVRYYEQLVRRNEKIYSFCCGIILGSLLTIIASALKFFWIISTSIHVIQ